MDRVMSNRSNIFRTVLGSITPIFFFFSVVLFYPFRFILEFDSDEGLSVIMAQMISQGFHLYSDVWSDHPPLFPHILSNLLQALSMNVTIARLFVLFLSCVLIWAVIQYLRFYWGSSHAIAGALLVIMLPYYTRLSVSVMIGLPSIVFAVLSFLCLAFWHSKRRHVFLLLSGIFLGISVMMKLQTGFLAIIFIMGLVITELHTNRVDLIRSAILKPAVLWTASFTIFVILVGASLIGSEGIPQLVNVHLAASSTNEFQSESGLRMIMCLLRDSWPIFTLGLIGSIYAIRRRCFTAIYLIAWILVGFILLTQLKPIWYHHQLLLTIPATLLAAIPIGEVIQVVRSTRSGEVLPVRSGFIVAVIIFTLAVFLFLRVPPTLNEYNSNLPNFRAPTTPATPLQEMLALIWDYADETELIVTDRPMFAFRTGIAVPPDLAVFSGKRFLTGMLTERDIIRVIIATNPEQVALTRFFMPEVEEHLSVNYSVKYDYTTHKLFIRNDISPE